MREPRNPFRLRASEQIESDVTFLRLFAPSFLELLPDEQLWDRVHILRSAPGGGKTSMMRLFTPPSLLALHAHRTVDDYKELYQRMRSLGAVSGSGPRLIGVLLSCERNYATFDDMDFDASRRERLFFSLLNARIVLAMLRGALALSKLDYPADLSRILIGSSKSADKVPPGLRLPMNGAELYGWAKSLEIAVCEAIDSLTPSELSIPPGQNTLWSLALMQPETILLDGKQIADRVLLMLDDVHKLTQQQRQKLMDTLLDLRSRVGIWVAERFEALSTDEMLSSGASEGRDYGSVIALEEFWRAKSKSFEKLVLNVADRRAQTAADLEIDSFGSCLEVPLDGTERDRIYSRIASEVAERVRQHAGQQVLFRDWVTAREEAEGTPREKALAWRTLEVLIERERRRSQQAFDFALPADELADKDDSAVKAAAELFRAKEFELPYYFGPSRLAQLASSNIEQFLWLAGDEFEEVASAALLRKTTELTPERQHKILLKAIRGRWETIPRRLRNGQQVRSFLDAIGSFAQWVTYLPNAPYSPGVTGVGILMEDVARLRDRRVLAADPALKRLADILATALADNLLMSVSNYKAKGEDWMILYLNRFACINFGLPLQYGGWREKSLRELTQWLEAGFKVPQKEPSLV